jgi:hypothetical protein
MSLSLAKPLPKGAEYLADVAEKAGADGHVSPYLLLGICYAESAFGAALKPPTPEGSGDFIARPATPDRDAKMASAPLPGVVRKVLPEGIKSRKLVGPTDAWVPTTTGWGCGLMQFDYEAHYEFCKSGAWKDPAKVFAQACKLLTGNRKYIAGKLPKLDAAALAHATIASYNAGAGRVVKFLSEGKALDAATFHPGYVAKICAKAEELAGASGAWMFPTAPVV